MSYLNCLLALLIGYLLGSLLPAYFLGRLLRKIDIRQVGTKNAGTTNVYRTLGLWPAVVTAVYDLSKGVATIALAYYCLGTPLWVAYLSGLLAIWGHIFPFYLNFSGGQGAATTLGQLFLYLFLTLKNGWFPWELLLLLGFLTLAFYFITRSGAAVGIVVLIAFLFLILTRATLNLVTIFLALTVAILLAINLYESAKRGYFKLRPRAKNDILIWRTWMRPLAVILPLAYFYLDKKWTLILIGSVAGVFIGVDLVRLVARQINLFFLKSTSLFKQKEARRFSSITSFLVAAFLIVGIFEKNIAITTLIFLVFGDVAAKYFGLQFGRTKIYQKTLEGSLAYFCTCVFCGYALLPYAPLNFWQYLLGGAVATVAEVLPWNLDDNFTVGIATAGAMQLWRMLS